MSEQPAIDGRKARTARGTRVQLLYPLRSQDGAVEQWMVLTDTGLRVPVRACDLAIEERGAR
jgi:hypothetical protein